MRLPPVLPPYITVRVSAARFSAIGCVTFCCTTLQRFAADGMGFLVRPLTMLPLPAVPRVHAACFGAMDGLLVRPFTVMCPPLSAPRLNAACFGAMGVGV